MACYNGEQSIKRQIDSILIQLEIDDELIISDDGSTDNTLSIVGSFRDGRIKVITNNGLKGPVGNFQNALNEASGNFIFLSDQDDIWRPDKVKVMSERLNLADLVLSDCRIVDQNLKQIIASFFSFRKSRPGFMHNLYKNSYIGCCMAFRREILEYVLPFPKHIHMHDWWIGLLVELKGSVNFIDLPLIDYVRHGNNVSPTGEISTNPFYKRFLNRVIILWYIVYRNLYISNLVK
ncbi:glycosyltransferase family 2 protein [Fibrivirga algicola]